MQIFLDYEEKYLCGVIIWMSTSLLEIVWFLCFFLPIIPKFVMNLNYSIIPQFLRYLRICCLLLCIASKLINLCLGIVCEIVFDRNIRRVSLESLQLFGRYNLWSPSFGELVSHLMEWILFLIYFLASFSILLLIMVSKIYQKMNFFSLMN